MFGGEVCFRDEINIALVGNLYLSPEAFGENAPGVMSSLNSEVEHSQWSVVGGQLSVEKLDLLTTDHSLLICFRRIQHRDVDAFLLCRLDSFFVARVNVARNSQARIIRQHTIESPRCFVCAVGNRDLPG